MFFNNANNKSDEFKKVVKDSYNIINSLSSIGYMWSHKREQMHVKVATHVAQSGLLRSEQLEIMRGLNISANYIHNYHMYHDHRAQNAGVPTMDKSS